MTPEIARIADVITSETYEVALYRYGDSQKLVVVCIHGLTRNAADFDYLAKTLASDYDVWSLDMPGRGNSPSLRNPALYNNAFYASLMAQWLETTHRTPVHFIGTSMGGMIGMILAATKPQLIKTLTLNDVGIKIPATEIQRIKEYVGVATNAAKYETLEAQLTKNLAQFGIHDEAVKSHFITHSITSDGAGGYRLRYDPAIREVFANLENKDIDLSQLWKTVKCPALIIRGEVSELLPAAVAAEMIQGRPDTVLYTVAGAGHAPSLTTPVEMNTIHDWLGKYR